MNMPRLLPLFVLALLAGCASTAVSPETIAAAEKSGICPVHHVAMAPRHIRITYGLVGGPPEEIAAVQRARFPFARRPILGGCVSMIVVGMPELSSPEFGDLFVCAECQAAKVRWAQAHSTNPWVQGWLEEAPGAPAATL